MAARINKRQTEQSKEAIRTTQLIKRLQNHALDTEEKYTMSQTQVLSARYLIGLNIPQLKAIEHSGEQSINHTILSDAEILARMERFNESSDT